MWVAIGFIWMSLRLAMVSAFPVAQDVRRQRKERDATHDGNQRRQLCFSHEFLSTIADTGGNQTTAPDTVARVVQKCLGLDVYFLLMA